MASKTESVPNVLETAIILILLGIWLFSLFFTIVGYFLANLTIYLNFKYNYFNLIFSSLPFKILPMNIELYTMLTILFFMNLFIVLSSTIPYLISKRSI